MSPYFRRKNGFRPTKLSKAMRRAMTSTTGLLASTSVLTLLLGNGSAQAAETIDGGTTVTIPGTHSSPWDVGNLLFTVGQNSSGTLIINGGGRVFGGASTDHVLGFNAGSLGTGTVSGVGSRWEVGNNFFVGYEGNGNLTVQNGGTVAVAGFSNLGTHPGSSGTATVTGGGVWTSLGSLNVGSAGTGRLTVTGGGSVASNGGRVGGNGSGIALVSGTDSSWQNSGDLTVGHRNAGTLTIEGGGTVTNTVGRIGDGAGTAGTVRVYGTNPSGVKSSWVNSGSLLVGSSGNGELTITGGGTVTSDGGTIASSLGSTGTVSVTGAGSSWENGGAQLTVGNYGIGALNIEDGGLVSGGNFILGTRTEGTVSVSGSGSSLASLGFIRIAGNSGARGELTIADGGEVKSNSGSVGYAGTGIATVSGAGSSWENTGNLIVGETGVGELRIESGGAVTNAASFLGGSTPSISGGNGTVVVTGAGSSWTNSGNLIVGNGGTGELIVTDGGTVSNNHLSFIGASPGGTGRVSVTGEDSAWINTGTLDVGYLGAGSLTIEEGGTVSNTVANVGRSAGASGTVTVSGAGSSWVNSGALNIGNAGNGELKIEDGGRVTSRDSTVAAMAGVTGAVTVSGEGSTWALEQLTVGDNGSGTLTVEGGGTVVGSAGASVGAGAGGTGFVTVSGTDSSWTVGGDLDVGIAGSGNLLIKDGGRVSSTAGNMGLAAGGNGTVTVSGEGSLWTNTGALAVGAGAGAGTLTISDAGVVSAAGVTLASAAGSRGTLNIGAGLGEAAGSAGTLDTPTLVFGAGQGMLTFNHLAPNYVFDVAMSGAAGQGRINVIAGTTRLSGDSSGFSGQTAVADHLIVDGSLGGTLTVKSGGQLEGIGTVGNTVVGAGGTLIGRQGETLNLASLNLAAGANVDVALGMPDSHRLFAISGDLTLDGVLDISDLGGFGAGVYRIMDYGGTLTDNVMDIGATPDGISPGSLSVQTSVAAQVNLVSTAGAVLNFWDGPSAPNNGIIEGGSGIWDAANANWTTADGTVNGAWNAGFAVFQGAAGTVTVDNGSGAIAVEGMQFASDGYVVNGDAIALAKDETIIRVGDGSRVSDTTATISSELTGTGGLVKTDFGTLILTADNSYSGGTFVRGGTLQVAADANLGAGGGELTLEDSTLATTADMASARSIVLEGDAGRFDTLSATTLALDGVVSGSGALLKQGDGTLILNGANSYTGDTFVGSGTLVGNSQSLRGHLVNDATTVFDQVTDDSFAGDIAGTGRMFKDGVGTLTLAGSSVLDWSIDDGRLISSGDRFDGNVAIAAAGTMQFNQTLDADYHGEISGSGTLDKTGSGLLQLSNDSGGFAGHTDIHAGGLRVDGALGGTLAVLSGGQLRGVGSVGSTTNFAGGIIAPGNSIGTLTINGDYTGNGGLLEIEAELGGDHSPADRLVITGASAGETQVAVLNRGGIGAQTIDGIKIIEIGGASNGSFSLLGDYVLNGEQVVIAGAYGYALHKNGVGTPDDGDWYLRSALVNPPTPPVDPPTSPDDPPTSPDDPPTPPTPPVDPPTSPDDPPTSPGDPPLPPGGPIYQPGAPVYEVYAQSLQRLNRVGTLQQRVGNRYWGEVGNGAFAQDDGATTVVPAPLPGGAGMAAIDARAGWSRIEGTHARIEPRSSTTAARYDYDVWQLQTGIDGKLYEDSHGLLIGGVTLQYGQVSTDVASVFGKGSIDTRGYGFGGTLTWLGQNGFYADAQARLAWYDSDLSSQTLHRDLASGNDGSGYALSLETGKRIAVAPKWTVTPQVQLAYSSVDVDTFTDPFGARVSLEDGDSLIGRLGVAAAYQDAWRKPSGKMARSSVYAIANLSHEFLEGASVDMAGVELVNADERTWGGIGAGLSYSWADGKYAIYGEASVNTSLSSFADSYSLNGTTGFRISW